MRFLRFLDGASAVRGHLVASEDGEVLAETESVKALAWTAARTVALAQELSVAGALVGLGKFTDATVRAAKSARLLAHGKGAFALVDLDPNGVTAELEALLRSSEWTSATEAPAEGTPEPSEAQIATVRPRAPGVPPPPPRPRLVPRGARVPALGAQAHEEPKPRARSGAHASKLSHERPPPPAASPSGILSAMTALYQHRRENALASAQQGALAVAEPAAEPLGEARRPTPTQTPALLTGSLELFALPDLLEFLRVGQRTGTLVCTSRAGRGTIHLRKGRILAAASPDVSSFGELLVERGAITREHLPELQRLQSQAPNATPLTTLLLAQELVARQPLQEALMLHVVRVLRRLMSWDSGDFSFDPQEPSALEHGVDLDPQGVLLNIFKDMDEAQRA